MLAFAATKKAPNCRGHPRAPAAGSRLAEDWLRLAGMRILLVASLAVVAPSCSSNPCVSDANCPDASYCDFTASPCSGSSLSTVSGTCRPNCGADCGSCSVDADCPPDQACWMTFTASSGSSNSSVSGVGTGGSLGSIGGRNCYEGNPCSGGSCVPENADCNGNGPPSCPAGCSLVRQPHIFCGEYCVCPSNTCVAPE